MKEITIRYKTAKEQEIDSKTKFDHSFVVVLIDGVPIPDLKKFSVTVEPEEAGLIEYTMTQYGEYPSDIEYHLP